VLTVMVAVMEYLQKDQQCFPKLAGVETLHCRRFIVPPNGHEEERDKLERVVEHGIH
jgi:hypothetical protein